MVQLTKRHVKLDLLPRAVGRSDLPAGWAMPAYAPFTVVRPDAQYRTP
jgi:hypothetical protein